MKKKKVYYLIMLVLIITVFFITLFIYEKNKETKLIIGNEEIVINSKTEQNIDIKTLQSETALTIKKQGNTKVKINDRYLDEEINLENLNISKKDKIKIEIPYFFIFTKTYYINTLPSDFPEYEVQGQSLYEGEYYLTTYNNLEGPFYLFKLDEKGQIKYYKKTDQITFDFKKEIIEGEKIYSYLEVVENEMLLKNTSYCPCKLILMNENYEVVKEIRYQNNDENEQPLENHGGLILGNNHYILATLEEIELDDGFQNGRYSNNKVTNNKIEEVKDGEVLWEFQTINYPELYSYCDFETVYLSEYMDYAHYNSCTIDKNDGNLICSFRNIDALIKINRTTGELMWILGGKGDQFNLTEEQKFAKQHAVEMLDDGTIILFDNGNSTDESRILEFKIDEENKEILEFNEYDLKVNSTFMGSAQKLDKNEDIYVICYGGGPFKGPLLEEKNIKTNEVYFSFNFINSKYLYRVYKIN